MIAHRGASVAHRENTLEAFAGAVRLGADMVELDVRRTRDGMLAVHHDVRLGDGRILAEVDVGSLPGEVPLLAAALDACAPLPVNIEIKNTPGEPDFDESEAVASSVTELVSAAGLHDRVLVSSFNLHAIDHVRSLDGSIRTAWLVLDMANTAQVLDRLTRHGHTVLHPHARLVSESLLDATRAAGVAVNTWTVDDPARIVDLAAIGVDGIVTNVPDIAREALDAWRERPPTAGPG